MRNQVNIFAAIRSTIKPLVKNDSQKHNNLSRFTNMSAKKKLYWYCQIIGWFLLISINGFYVAKLGRADNKLYWISLTLFAFSGIGTTHLMRFVMQKLGIKKKPFKKQIFKIIGVLLIFSIIISTVSEIIDSIIGYIPESMKSYGIIERMLIGSINSIGVLMIWNCLYYIYHFTEKNRIQELDTIRLESLVKSLELKTIKSHINPHFIFNSLNSIRALVDENPQRARKAITELSNILRSSMQAEKVDTVPFSQELDIVKDYLALEQMRFEERLQLEFNIDSTTLHLPIPPMMLQMLAENAIKHGISKQINGGIVCISSRINLDMHEITVENTGSLDEKLLDQNNGFGLKSTQDQLNMLYDGKASFSIRNNSDKSRVISTILMPVKTI